MFVENGVTGNSTLASRPAGGELLQRLQSGDIVIVAKLDRISRLAGDALKSIDCMAQRGARLFVVDVAGKIPRPGGVGKLTRAMLAALAEFERNRNRHRGSEITEQGGVGELILVAGGAVEACRAHCPLAQSLPCKENGGQFCSASRCSARSVTSAFCPRRR
jgi:hypothetical protein